MTVGMRFTIDVFSAALRQQSEGDAPRVEPARLAGARVLFDPAGALVWPEQGLCVVSDLHLEKGAAFARRGVFLPPYDTAETLGRLEALFLRHAIRTVVSLGDSFHDRAGPKYLDEASARRLRALTSRVDWIWITGNHDPDPPEGLGGRSSAVLSVGPFTFRHAPTPARIPGEVAGHLHPSARIVRRGRSVRARAFASDGSRLVMPAFGAYTGGLNVLDVAFDGLFEGLDFHAWMIGEAAVHPVRARHLHPG
jgi:DNA ligase-associated metallophosphoesterase